MAANLGANIDLCPESLNIDELNSSDFLLFDNFSLSSKKGIETLEYSLSMPNNVRLFFGISDINLIKENYKSLKKVLLNKIDTIYGTEGEVNALQKVMSNPAKNTLSTRGSQGAKYNQVNIKASKTDIINSNGAGDALIGTFLAYLDIIDNKSALEKAVSYATEICKVSGPRL